MENISKYKKYIVGVFVLGIVVFIVSLTNPKKYEEPSYTKTVPTKQTGTDSYNNLEIIQTTEAFAPIRIEYKKGIETVTKNDIEIEPYLEIETDIHEDLNSIVVKPILSDWKVGETYSIFIKGQKEKVFSIETVENAPLSF